MKRNPSFMIINAYFPSFSIMVMTVIPLFLKEDVHFGTAITLVLTAFLCLFSLFQSSLSDVPKTAYTKFIDYWNIMALIVPLSNFFLLLFWEISSHFSTKEISFQKWTIIKKWMKIATPAITIFGTTMYIVVACKIYYSNDL